MAEKIGPDQNMSGSGADDAAGDLAGDRQRRPERADLVHVASENRVNRGVDVLGLHLRQILRLESAA